MTNTENLFELVYLLLAKKRMTAGEIAARFGVSIRTIYRWVESLCIAGIPIVSIQGRGGGLYLDERYALDKTVLSEDEKVNILAAVNAFSSLSGTASDQNSVRSAARKLQSLSTQNADWLEIDFGTWNPLGSYIRTVFDLVRSAIIKKQQLSFDYYAYRGESGSRTVEPWKLLFRGQAWYLYGWCIEKKDARYFKLSRMQHVKNTRRPAQVPVGGVKKEHTGDFSDSLVQEVHLVTLVVKVPAAEAYRIMDDYMILRKEPVGAEETGMLLLTFQMQDGYWMLSYLLSFGARLEVIAPEQVKRALAEEISKMYEMQCRRGESGPQHSADNGPHQSADSSR